MTPTNGVTSAADYFRRAEMSGRWRLVGLPREDLPMPELLAAVYFAASDLPPPGESFRDRGLAQRQHRGPESLLITASATRAPPLAHRRPAFAAAGNLLNSSTRYGDSRVDASPRRNVSYRRRYGRGGGVGRGLGVGV